MSLQMLKKAMIAYVANSMKAVWSVIAHPLSIVGKKNCDVADYRIYGNSVQEGTPTPETPIEVQSVGELTTKNIFDIDSCLNECLVKNDDGTYTLRKTSLNGRFSNWVSVNIPANTKWAKGADFTERNLTGSGGVYRVCGMQVEYEDGTGGTTVIYSNTYGGSTSAAHVGSFTKNVVRARLYLNPDDAVGDYVTFKNLQIEIGEESTEYEPYHKYKIPVTVRGKNLCPNDWEVGSISTTGANTSSSSYVRTKDYFALDSSKTYYLSCDDIGMKGEENQATITWFFYDGNKSFISRVVSYKNRTVSGVIDSGIDIPAGTAFYRLCVQTPNPDIRVQIEEGTSATLFEPYIEPQTVNMYLDEPLRKVGDYADCVDFGKGVVLRNVGKRIFTGEENMQELGLSNTSYLYRYAVGVTEMANLYSDRILMSNYFATGDYLDIRDNPSPVVGILSVSRIAFSTSIPAKDAFKLWIADLYDSNPLYVCYPLSTPIEEPIILPKLPQFKGTTIYEVQADIPPSGMQVCYYG